MGLLSGLFGGGNYVTVKVKGALNPIIGKNVEEKKFEKIEEMERQGYVLVGCTGQDVSGGFIVDCIEYTLVFRRA